MSSYNAEKLIAFVTEKWGGKNCPMCNTGSWTVQDKVFQLSEFHDGNLVIGGPLVPIVPITCTNCGHTVILNAIIAGAVIPSAFSEKKNE